DGRRGGHQPPHHHRERRLLAERHRASADDGDLRQGAGPLRPRGPRAPVDGRRPQDDADAGAATRGARAGDAAAGTPAGRGGLARGSENLASRGEVRMDGDLLYVGTYTDSTRSEGIYVVRMDRRSGELRPVGSAAAGGNPSFLAIHPDGRVLYAVNEVERYAEKASGAVSAFAIARDSGALTRLNEQPSQGG